MTNGTFKLDKTHTKNVFIIGRTTKSGYAHLDLSGSKPFFFALKWSNRIENALKNSVNFKFENIIFSSTNKLIHNLLSVDRY